MSFDLAIIGGTGDLAWRKLMPALFQAFRHGKLPGDGRILAVGRDDHSAASYHDWLSERFGDVDPDKRPVNQEFAQFAQLIDYLRVDLTIDSDYVALAQWLRSTNREAKPDGKVNHGPGKTIVLYLATSPHLYPQICRQLGAVGLNTPEVRVVLEKPLGHDLDSAQEINRAVSAVFDEAHVFRIDHYLGKPAVQNLMALRFGNSLFEPLWRRESIANIQITLAEQLGVGTRAGYYDRTGALRDMIQNHALQLLTMIAMEPPSRREADTIRTEKLKVLQALKPFSPASLTKDVVRGQYREGNFRGNRVQGYLDEAGVAPDSQTETFVALRTEVQNWRWAGVPFYLRTGKYLPAYDAQIVINFHPTPHNIFAGSNAPNKLVIKLQPSDGLELHLLATKGTGQSRTLAPVSLDLDFNKAIAEYRVGAYERLLLEVLDGRLNLFVHRDEQEQAWLWVMPILEAWQQDDDSSSPLRPYAAGSWGPPASSALVARDGFSWPEES